MVQEAPTGIPSEVIGTDLGTPDSVVAVMEGEEPAVILNQEGARITPSAAGFDKGVGSGGTGGAPREGEVVGGEYSGVA